jgi:hypothetical protein
MKYGHLPDTTREQIAHLLPIHVHGGLWFEYNGERRTPHNLYFSSDLREWWDNPEEYGGRLYTHFDNALRPVYAMDGKQYEERDIRCVSARYDADKHLIYGYYKQ